MLITHDEAPPSTRNFRPRLFAIIGTVVLHLFFALFMALKSVIPAPDAKPEIVAELAPDEQLNEKKVRKEEVKKQVTQTAAAAPRMTRVLRSDALALMAIPDMTALADSPIGLGEGDLGIGFGQGPANMGSGGMFFGQRITGRLGVVFDVSGSMHEYVPIVVEEIQRTFRTAMVVCVNSSRLTNTTAKAEAFRYSQADSSNVSMFSTGREEARQMDKDLRALPNCFYISRDHNSLGDGIEFLSERGVRIVFVFSDFQDTYHGDYLERLTAQMKQRGVQINFQVLSPLSGSSASREALLQKVCLETRGRYAVGELLKRVRR